MVVAILYMLCFVSILKGAIQYAYFKGKKKKYYKTEGVIVSNYLDESPGKWGYKHYYPIVEFTDRDGQTVQIQSDNYNPDLPMYEEGTTVSIIVNPDDNTRLLFDEKADEIIIPLVWIGIGVVGLFICYFFIQEPN